MALVTVLALLISYVRLPSVRGDAAPPSVLGGTSPTGSNRAVNSELSTEDLLSVMISSGDYLALAEASRAWRQGIPSIIVSRQSREEVDAEIGIESYEKWIRFDSKAQLPTYPDTWTVDGAVSPFLAYEAHPDFKWMFWGDDDTVMFLEPAKAFLKGLDHEMPYYLVSDDLLWAHDMSAQHHGEPDTDAWPDLPRHEQIPSRLQEVQALVSMDFCQKLRPFANRIYQHNGGGGTFLSVGFFKAMDVRRVKQCIVDRIRRRERANVLQNLSSDTLFTGCVWQVAGLAPSTEAKGSPWLNWAGPNGIYEGAWERQPHGRCNSTCQLEARHTISKHVNSRAFPSLHLAAHHIQTLVQQHDSAWHAAASS